MKSFLQGKANLAVPALRPPTGPTPERASSPLRALGRAPHGAGAAAVPAQTNVAVVKEGDKVVRLVVTCACGEQVEIECLYSAGS